MPVQDFIQSDTVLLRPIQIKLPEFPPARIKLRFKTFKIKYLGAFGLIKMKREVRQIHWYTAEKEKTNDTKVIKDQTYCIFYN